ncbi:uncharacterized protein [Amphiura filiformis]|uniref:uncharacterized protein n=1 Tax=Amphiura filiformis TaxID=82378 RepID=UPI003B21DB47
MNFSDTIFNGSGCNTSNQFSVLEDQDGNEEETQEGFETQDPVDVDRSRKQNKTQKKKNSRDSLRIMLINFQSITNKTCETKILIEQYNPDIIQGTETWLTADINTSEIFPDSYDVFRRDRKGRGHGGILIACKKDLIMTQKSEFEVDSEIMWNQLELQGRRSLLLGTCYKPRHDDRETVIDLGESLGKINSKAKGYNIILTGDFNQPNMDWKEGTVIKNHPASKETAELLLETITEFGLEQHVKEPTRKKSILDLVFTNNASLIKETTVVPGISDHDIVLADFDLRAKWKRQPRRRYYVRRKADTESISKEFLTFKDEYFSLGNASVQDKWDALENKIKVVMERHIPKKTAAKQNSLPWFNRTHHRLRRKKQRAFNKAKETQKTEDWNKFVVSQKELKKALEVSEREFVSNNLTTAMKENVKQFWSYIKRLGNNETGFQTWKSIIKLSAMERGKLKH